MRQLFRKRLSALWYDRCGKSRFTRVHVHAQPIVAAGFKPVDDGSVYNPSMNIMGVLRMKFRLYLMRLMAWSSGGH